MILVHACLLLLDLQLHLFHLVQVVKRRVTDDAHSEVEQVHCVLGFELGDLFHFVLKLLFSALELPHAPPLFLQVGLDDLLLAEDLAQLVFHGLLLYLRLLQLDSEGALPLLVLAHLFLLLVEALLQDGELFEADLRYHGLLLFANALVAAHLALCWALAAPAWQLAHLLTVIFFF